MNINQINLPQLLIGRSIEMVSEQTNTMYLDDGTSLTIVPFQHCPDCDHGSYQVDEISWFPVPIESVRISTEHEYEFNGSAIEIITISVGGEGVEKPVITISGNPDIIFDTAQQIVAEETGFAESLRSVQSLKEAGLLSEDRFHVVVQEPSDS